MSKVDIRFDAYCKDISLVNEVMAELTAEGIEYTLRYDADSKYFNLYGTTTSKLVGKVEGLLEEDDEWTEYR